MKTKVIFRTFKNKEVIALFPYEKHNNIECLSYMEIGQHGGANYSHVISITKPVKDIELENLPLRKELINIGYDLEIIKRRNCNA